jgi:hypothetical protein
MAIPDRPVAAAPIETEWGQAVHDYTFAPSGCTVHGTTGTSLGGTLSKMNLSIADDDPGGYLNAANNRVVIPSGGEGLYSVFLKVRSVNGSAGAGYQTRASIYLNGTGVAYDNDDNAGATNVVVTVIWIGDLAAGDHIEVYAQKRGGGTAPDVTVEALTVVRMGSELGA